jgi:succinate dehydrogenase/fumarate reductase-like Fe-S protein
MKVTFVEANDVVKLVAFGDWIIHHAVYYVRNFQLRLKIHECCTVCVALASSVASVRKAYVSSVSENEGAASFESGYTICIHQRKTSKATLVSILADSVWYCMSHRACSEQW